jgi:hypothetical protein
MPFVERHQFNSNARLLSSAGIGVGAGVAHELC